MKVLLDVNLLLAIANAGHSKHQVASRWLAALASPQLLTCAISELGFVRISTAMRMQPSIVAAISELERWKTAAGATFVGDVIPVRSLPSWVQSPAQTTDGHLFELARSHRAQFATLDRGIPGALLVS